MNDGYREVLAIDFDNTIVNNVNSYPDIGYPIIGSKEFLKELHKKGYKILIFSSRLCKEMAPTDTVRNYMIKKIDKYMKQNDLYYDEIAMPEEGKPRILALVDDRAIHFDGNYAAIINKIDQMYETKLKTPRNLAIDEWLDAMSKPKKREILMKSLSRKMMLEEKNDRERTSQ